VCPEVLPKRGAVRFPSCRPQFLLRIRLAYAWQHTGRAPTGYASSADSGLAADHKAFARVVGPTLPIARPQRNADSAQAACRRKRGSVQQLTTYSCIGKAKAGSID
jgi:hypothetical protein